MLKTIKTPLIPVLLFFFFVIVFINVRSFYQGGFTFGYSDYPILIDKLGYINIVDILAGSKKWITLSPLFAQFARENISATVTDVYLGHILFIPLNLYAYAIIKLVCSSFSYKLAGIYLNSCIGALGIVLFFDMLRSLGKDYADALFGVVLLGFNWYYSQNSLQNDSGLYAMLSILIIMYAYVKLLRGKITLIKVVSFWLLFSFASLLYLNTVPVIPVIFIMYAVQCRSLKLVARFAAAAFIVGFCSLCFFYHVILKHLAESGVWVFGDSFFDVLAFASYYSNACCATGLRTLCFPIDIAQSFGGLFFSQLGNSVNFLLGLLLLCFIGYIALYKFVCERAKDHIFTFAFLCAAVLMLYIILARQAFYPKIYAAAIVPISYIICEGFSLARRRLLPGWYRPGLMKNVLLLFVGGQVVMYVMYAYFPLMRNNAFFNMTPATDKKMLGERFFSFVKENTESDAVVLYDSSYIDRVLGSLLLIHSDRMSLLNMNTNITFLGNPRASNTTGGTKQFTDLASLIANKGNEHIYLLATRMDTDKIIVPADSLFSYYYVFNKVKTCSEWGLFLLDEKSTLSVELVNELIRRCGKSKDIVSVETGKQYGRDSLMWDMFEEKNGTKALVLVPLQRRMPVSPKDKYLCYW